MLPRRSFYTVPLPGRAPLVLGERTLVMGILNVSPDSFAEKPTARDVEAFVARALGMEADGADIIDLGGESTRPGAELVSADVERDRVMPVVEALAGRLRILLSIDTSKAAVASAALSAGAAMVNDVSGLRRDPELSHVVAAAGAALVIMHGRGTPKTMNLEAVYDDLMADIAGELRERVDLATAAGVPIERIIVDPGIGFAKRPSHSYGVLARLPELATALDRPILVGPSRKSYLREAASDRPAYERDWGTAAAVTAAVLAGAHVVRVHAVAEMVQVVRVAEEIRKHGSL
jgi:dihydropteroate synthase